LPSSFENILFFHAQYDAASQGLEIDMSQDYSRETRAEKVSSLIGSMPAHSEENRKASRVAAPRQLLEMLQHCQARDFVNFLVGTSRGFFWSVPMAVSGARPEMRYRKHP
jgi:hypothetical protein